MCCVKIQVAQVKYIAEEVKEIQPGRNENRIYILYLSRGMSEPDIIPHGPEIPTQ